jgi:hypothetical protein
MALQRKYVAPISPSVAVWIKRRKKEREREREREREKKRNTTISYVTSHLALCQALSSYDSKRQLSSRDAAENRGGEGALEFVERLSILAGD